MVSLQGTGAFDTASAVAGRVRLSGNLAVSFGPRFWWYDVHQVEGAV
jgi:hypothetical protein